MFVQLAHPYTNQDVTGWWWSVKLDGQRAVWIPDTRGRHKRDFSHSNTTRKDDIATGLWSRLGNIIYCPDSFVDNLPPVPLDGELYHSGGRQTMRSIVSRLVPSVGWSDVSYNVFDIWDDNTTYYDAYIRLVALEGITVVKQTPIEGDLYELAGQQDEGIMVRNPWARYARKRSSSILKVKNVSDAEATVVGYTDGEGKYKGMLGAYEMLESSGIRFKLSGMDDAMRASPLPIGTVVTFRYCRRTDAGVPQEARFWRAYDGEG